MKRALALFIVACASLCLSGCSDYYKIRDPVSGTVYYTNDFEKKSGGAIRFKDIVTQQLITLNNSEVMRITKDEYRANVHQR